MGRHSRYGPEFRRSAIALVAEQNYTIQKAAESLGITVDTLKYWLREHRRKHGPLNSAEETDLQKQVIALQRENEKLRLERDILKKAAAYFAREQP
jgi:transposase